MKYLGYVESPLQAFNLMEYVELYNIELDILIVNKKTFVSEHNFLQISSVINFIRYKKLCLIDIESNKNNVFKIKSFISKNIQFRELLNENVSLIGGEYRSMVFWFIVHKFKQRQIVLLDDGTATLKINRISRGLKQLLKALIMESLGCTDAFKEKISFFSIYNISDKISSHDSIIKHQYKSFAKKTLQYPDDVNSIYVIGTPLFEAGVVECNDIDITLTMLCNIKRMFQDKEIIYIPHRRERKDKIIAIKNIVSVEFLDYPFELFPLINRKNICFMAGLYSSLFDNMMHIYNGHLLINSFYVPSDIISPSWRSFVENIYSNYKQYNANSFVFRDITTIDDK